jgi:hypothetical protein
MIELILFNPLRRILVGVAGCMNDAVKATQELDRAFDDSIALLF